MSEKWEKALKQAKASLAVEGLYLTPEEERLILDNLEGKITEEEFFKLVLEKVKGS